MEHLAAEEKKFPSGAGLELKGLRLIWWTETQCCLYSCFLLPPSVPKVSRCRFKYKFHSCEHHKYNSISLYCKTKTFCLASYKVFFLIWVNRPFKLDVATLSHCCDHCLLLLAASAFSTWGSLAQVEFLRFILHGVDCHTWKSFSITVQAEHN